ncbi:annexin A10 [Erethizon dorsatum]
MLIENVMRAESEIHENLRRFPAISTTSSPVCLSLFLLPECHEVFGHSDTKLNNTQELQSHIAEDADSESFGLTDNKRGESPFFLINSDYQLSCAESDHMVQGTIFPAPNFNPIMDAQMLGGALQGFDCDKDMLINILTQRSNAQRLMIAGAYQSMFGRDLICDLKEQLSSHFKEVMVGLMYPPPSYDAHELWHAMKGAGTDENCLIEILASRTNGEIFQIREAYCLQHSTNLQEDIYSDTSGHFRDTLMNLVQGSRQEGCSDPAMAAQDAMVLWEACQQKTGEHKTMLQMLLCNKSCQQLWLVFQQFQNISGQDLVDAINDCYDGYFQELLVAIVLCVRDKPAYFAYRLYSAIHDFGFHNKTVIRILIARSEIDLLTIRKRYKERYGKSLFHDIKNFASGHYKKALLAICAGDMEDY